LSRKERIKNNKENAPGGKNDNVMDDGLEIFVYLFFIIASIIGAVVKNSAKRKEEERRKAQRGAAARNNVPTYENTGEKKKAGSMLEEFIRQQLEEFEVPENRKPQEILVDEPALDSKEEKYIKEEGNAVFDSTDAALLSDNMREENFSISDSISDLEKTGEVYNFNYNKIAEDEISDVQKKEEFFDARKALIYSEIFKRPEY
jgi:hypothetical protein